MFEIIIEYLFWLAAIAACWTVWMRWIAPVMAGVKSLQVDEYKQKFKKVKHTLIDVRNEDEYASGHAIRAMNIPLDVIAKQLHEVKDDIPADRPVVVICATGNRSATGATALAKAGFAPVYNITGGMTDWNAANIPTKKGKK